MSSSPEQIPVRKPWWYPTPHRLAVLLLVLALIGGLSWGVWRANHCAPGVRRLGGECVGVSDGSFKFTPGLAEVLDKIREENRRVEQTGEPFVSIAYLVPLPKGRAEPSDVLRHELQGAHLAQLRANHISELGDQPMIRLLVANAGEHNNQWEPVVGQLVDMVDSERLVAVAGFGQSRAGTLAAIDALAGHGIPMVAARLTADNLSDHSGFVRVAPTNRDQAKVAVAVLKHDPKVSRVLLIQDDNQADPFVKTLGSAFTDEARAAGLALLEPTERYDASLDGVANTFRDMMSSICHQSPDVVYFAGRGSDLEAFLRALPERPCLDFPVNVMTGDSAGGLAATEELQAALKAGINLRYTSLTHPGAWAAAPNAFAFASIRRFQETCEDPEDREECFTTLFPNESLDDGAAMGHDAVVTAVRAIRDNAGQRDLDVRPIVPSEVIQAFNRLHDCKAVSGASGWISLGNSDPINKAIPILELKEGADGAVEVVFVELSSPNPDGSGTPFIPPPTCKLAT